MPNLLKLPNGNQLPILGLGTWKIAKDLAPSLVKQAIDLGYRHLDCACDYGNEAQVGQGICAVLSSGACRRDDLWITSKLWNTYHAPEHVRPAIERTLLDLGVDYLDLYLIHFPLAQQFVPFDQRYPPGWFTDPDAPKRGVELVNVPLHETWRAMEDLVTAGLVRNIGVCNYGTALLRDLLNYAAIRPTVLQVEMHPMLAQSRLLRFCQNEGIAVTAFSPLGAPSYVPLRMARAEESLFTRPVIVGAAREHKKTPAQVVLRWGVQRQTAVIPKTASVERLAENMGIFDFELSATEMRAISALDANRRFNDPAVFGEEAFHTYLPIYD